MFRPPEKVTLERVRGRNKASAHVSFYPPMHRTSILEEHMENLSNKWALVTGASSGFGVQFANLLAEREANLVLVARRTEPMETLADELRQKHSVQVVVEGMDLSRTGVAAELKSRLDARGISIDILVN